MTPKEMAVTAAKALDSKKGHDIQVIDVENLTSLADYFVICSGTSNTQINALCDAVEKAMKEHTKDGNISLFFGILEEIQYPDGWEW